MRASLLSAIALLSVPASAATNGPAVLIIKTSDGYQFAQFSSMQRCEEAKAAIIAERQAKSDEWDRRGFKTIVPAEFSARCVLG